MNHLFLINAIMAFSTLTCLLCVFYLFRVSNQLYLLHDKYSRFVMSFGFIVLAYTLLKNTIPLNEDMKTSAIIMQEIFRVLVPLAFSVLTIILSKYINEVSHNTVMPFKGIDRRHNEV